ncbi:hypothetical protein LA02_1524 [Francisella philomiragia]|nr:hypothetical protein LA02_1524 [Francisella philomiragia]
MKGAERHPEHVGAGYVHESIIAKELSKELEKFYREFIKIEANTLAPKVDDNFMSFIFYNKDYHDKHVSNDYNKEREYAYPIFDCYKDDFEDKGKNISHWQELVKKYT